MKFFNYLRVAILFLLFHYSQNTHSQTWVGGGSGWNDPANWSSNPSLPVNGSTIYINGSTATVDAFSSFRPGEIRILNGGQLIITNTLDISSEGITYIDGIGSKLIINSGGLYTAEFIFATNGAEIEITGGELDVNDQLNMSDGTFEISGGLLDYNGSTNEELRLNNSDFDMSGGNLEFNRGIIVTGGTFIQENGSTMTATNSGRNIEFHNAIGSFAGTVSNSTGDLSLFGTSVVDLQSSLSMDLDDLVMNDDGQSSTLNIHGTLVAFDDVKFDEDPPDDIPGDADMIIVKDGGSLTINDSFRDASGVESGSGIHAESGGTVDIGDVVGMTDEEAYGSILSSDDGAILRIGGGTPLPVELVSFTATTIDHHIEINWSTAIEINNSYFELLKSSDGKNFTAIANINGSGNSNELKTYSYPDNDVFQGVYFYQLKQVDFNGDFEYHQIINVHFSYEIEKSISIFPNPVSSGLVTIVSDRNISKPILSIYSLSGSLIREMPLASSNKWTVSKSKLNLSNGTYIFKIIDQITGSTIDSIKVSITE